MIINNQNVTEDWSAEIPMQSRLLVQAYLGHRVSATTLAKWLGYNRSTIGLYEAGKQDPGPAMRCIYMLLHRDPSFIHKLRELKNGETVRRDNASSEDPPGEGDQ